MMSLTLGKYLISVENVEGTVLLAEDVTVLQTLEKYLMRVEYVEETVHPVVESKEIALVMESVPLHLVDVGVM